MSSALPLRVPGLKGFARRGLSAVVIKIGAAGLSFLMFVSLARAMSQAEFGQFGFAFSLATILAVVGSLGQRNLVLRFAAIYLSAGDEAQGRGVIHHSARLVLLGCGGTAAILLLGSVYSIHGPLLRATAVLTIALGLAEFLPSPQRAAGRVWLALLPRDIVLRLAMISVAGLAAKGLVPELTAVQTLWIMSALMLALTCVQAMLLPQTRPDAVLTQPRDTQALPEWRSAMWGLWGNSVVNSAGRNLAMVILGVLLSGAAVGAMFAALRTAMVMELFLMAINIVAAPMLASRLHSHATSEAQTICRKVALLIGMPTLAAFLLLVVAGDRVLNLFGAGYAIMHAELVILAAGYLVSALAGPTMQLMEMGGYERAYFKMLVVTTGVSLVALPFAVMWFGTIGAALCIAGNLVVLNIWASLFIHAHMGLTAGLLPMGARA
ncbi:lipopolysaccharide biosynthesis protein [Aliishimia ponticola]|uniref:Lipopolysaccharide biosynthesis protein n=1 Tax=Aliishimia ponticola TaxID=2499833 RepID=A0A4S4N9W4_9RHOB|nr:lipopolysaccharide biosynthesis protein [Aliishimia ponticola]THH35435.1 lipopolysaccharide biosynthesis protein [Aliishimia ponticola]